MASVVAHFVVITHPHVVHSTRASYSTYVERGPLDHVMLLLTMSCATQSYERSTLIDHQFLFVFFKHVRTSRELALKGLKTAYHMQHFGNQDWHAISCISPSDIIQDVHFRVVHLIDSFGTNPKINNT